MHIPALILFLTTRLITPVYAQSPAPLSLQSSTDSPQTGQSFTVTIGESVTQGTIGTDVVLIYDATALKFESASEGDAYGQYPNIESAGATPGVVRISGIPSDITEPSPATGTFATVTFIPQNPGDTSISIDYAAGDTTKSGIIPAEGSSDNLLTAAPTPLTLTVSGKALVQATPIPKTTQSGAIDAKEPAEDASSLLTVLGIIGGGALVTLLIVFFLIKRHNSPKKPPTPIPPTPPPAPARPTAPAVVGVAPPTPQPPTTNMAAAPNPEDALYGVSVPGAQPIPPAPAPAIPPAPARPTAPAVVGVAPPVGPNPEDALRNTGV